MRSKKAELIYTKAPHAVVNASVDSSSLSFIVVCMCVYAWYLGPSVDKLHSVHSAIVISVVMVRVASWLPRSELLFIAVSMHVCISISSANANLRAQRRANRCAHRRPHFHPAPWYNMLLFKLMFVVYSPLSVLFLALSTSRRKSPI